ncbi:zinc finger 518A [Pelobates cultripes]|uniref:Zinc finger 518A n=1 Tax=Pelobates cultripes TaxID=61616 RepID=A0AAD1WQY4_PELCU|nr:zinc finger 518A [Pelobates cultripes]
MRSPNKDFPLDTEDSAPTKDVDFWEYAGDNYDTNEPTSSSSFSMNDCLSSEIEENVGSAKAVGENALNEKVQKSPCRKQTARKSVCRGNVNTSSSPEEMNVELKLESNADDDAANISAKVLHFFCQKCNNGIRYSPNDLQKHFQILHNGELPLYPCEMCNFSANDFQVFKQHRKTHRSALVKCEICNNDYMYTLLGLTKHFSSMHCINGRFSCSKCRFSTVDVGTFVQHIHRHNGIEYACQKCNHISFSRLEFQRHLQDHATLFPFSCQYCNYSAMRKDFIVKHVLARHREHVQTKDEFVEETCNSQLAQTAAGLKLLLKKYQMESPNKALWRKDAQGMSVEKASEDQQSTSGLQYKPTEDGQMVKEFTTYNYDQASKDEISSVTTIKCNSEDGSLLQNAVHGPTVLMVKNNKINVPANYCATFMGYKMVNGKQNLVIKLLPSNKQAAHSLKTSSPSASSMSRVSQSPSRSYSLSSNGMDSRSAQPFKYSTQCSPSSASTERNLGPAHSMSQPATPTHFIARRNQSPVSMKSGSANSQAFFETIRKDLRCHTMPNSSYSSDFTRKIKEEPEDFSINEQQNYMHVVNDQKSCDTGGGRMNPSSVSSYLNVNSKADNLYRHRHNSESSGLTARALYTKDSELRSSTLPTSTASSHGRFASANANFQSKNDFLMRNASLAERQQRSLESMRCNNMASMPRITSVFSLNNRSEASSSSTSPKNTYLHNMLQENKRINDKGYLAKTPSPLIGSNTFTSPKQSPSNPPSKFDPRVSNGDSVLKGSVTNSGFMLKQEQETSGSGLKSYSLTVSELLKSHSDSIVNQQLAKEKISSMVRVPTGSSGLQLVRNPHPSSISHPNSVLYPPSNRFLLPVIPTSQSNVRMVRKIVNAPNSVGMSAPNRANAPLTINTKPGMVLTFTNGPFGTIRNMSSVASQGVSAVGNQAKFPLPRLQHPPAPQTLKTDFRDIGKSQNVSGNIHSGSTTAKNLPINLNLLQYCINSGSSTVTTGNMGSAANHQESLQKQPVYAILPDGKQAVLLNYVLPKAPAVSQRSAQGERFIPKILPKKTEDSQQTMFLNKNGAIPVTSIKKEDTSLDNGFTGSNDHRSSFSYPSSSAERKPSLRSTSNLASAECLNSTQKEKDAMLSSANAKVPNLRCRQSIPNTWNTRNRSMKRKASVDSSLSRVDFEVRERAAKKKTENVQEPPRKKMLHRKCKEKTNFSETENATDLAGPKQTKEVVSTLRLYPFDSNQLVQCPRKNQPVVVLNHPDVDIPEVINVMNTISRFSGHIVKVTLSKSALEALLESKLRSGEMVSDGLSGRRHRRAKPVSPVKERFVLKLTLKKTSKNNYKIVKNTPGSKLKAKFNCWFCGRIFDNQDAWVGHGQRHLMEATKDWNTLF